MEGVNTLSTHVPLERNRVIQEAVEKERPRLLQFIRRRIRNESDAEDLVQDVFLQFTNAYDIAEPIRQVSAWLFRTTRNRITDYYRKKKTVPFSALSPVASSESEDGNALFLEELWSATGDTPEDRFLRDAVWEVLEEALAELPDNQREVFVWHELEGQAFQEIAERTGVALNTLLSRKRYAVLHLRERLREVYDALLDR